MIVWWSNGNALRALASFGCRGNGLPHHCARRRVRSATAALRRLLARSCGALVRNDMVFVTRRTKLSAESSFFLSLRRGRSPTWQSVLLQCVALRRPQADNFIPINDNCGYRLSSASGSKRAKESYVIPSGAEREVEESSYLVNYCRSIGARILRLAYARSG